MAYPADFSRTVVLKARRDTIVLVAAVTVVTFALSSAIHSRPGQQQPAPPVAQQEWTGDLASLPTDGAVASGGEPLTSASLVVPSSMLKLPNVPVRELVKLHGCDGGLCPAKASAPTPVRRPAGEVTVVRRLPPRHVKPSLLARLNPFNHLPDMGRIRRPLTVAGDTVSGWFNGL